MAGEKITMITGGTRSGKSRHALDLAARFRGRRVFIATSESVDDEMRERIRKHVEERAGRFTTIEEPLDLGGAIESVPSDCAVAVVDCLTVWLGNLAHRSGELETTETHVQRFLSVLNAAPCSIVVVTNEVGMGIVPDSAMGRRFRDIAGRVNQIVAQEADKVVLMISGIPVIIKGGRIESV